MKTNDSIKENNEMLNNKAQQLPEPPAEIDIEMSEDEPIYAVTFLPWQYDVHTCDYAKDILKTLRTSIGTFNIHTTDAAEENVIVLTHKPSEELLKQIGKFVKDRELGTYGLLQILKINTESDIPRVLKLVTTNEL